MPNQANYPDPLNGTYFQRPERVSAKDLNLLHPGQQQILFGTSVNDNVEIWIYNPDGTFAGHQTLGPTDTALTLTTLVDNTGTYELLNIDMKDVANRIGIAPGRYSFVGNFFRDEVGSEAGYKLYISQISDDRTELQLRPVQRGATYDSQSYDWVVPGVPREFAAGLMIQLFGADISGSVEHSLNPSFIAEILNAITPLTTEGLSVTDRINYAEAGNAYTAMINTINSRALTEALNLLAADVTNNYIQQIELDKYIQKALLTVMYAMVSANEIDPRFELNLPVISTGNSNQVSNQAASQPVLLPNNKFMIPAQFIPGGGIVL
jgi:hypothetical protein